MEVTERKMRMLDLLTDPEVLLGSHDRHLPVFDLDALPWEQVVLQFDQLGYADDLIERAAILECDGGLSRYESQMQAAEEITLRKERFKDELERRTAVGSKFSESEELYRSEGG